MIIRDKGASILIGLATLGALIASGPEAKGTSITITGLQSPGTGDPPWFLIFDITLQNNSPFVLAGDSFTINNLTGITPTSPVTAPNGSWISTISQTSITSPFASDVTWTYEGNTPISAPADLGLFTVETSISFAAPPYTSGTLIYYSYTLGMQNASGVGAFPMSIPEPSSGQLLVTGTGIAFLSILLPMRRHCRHQRHSHAA